MIEIFGYSLAILLICLSYLSGFGWIPQVGELWGKTWTQFRVSVTSKVPPKKHRMIGVLCTVLTFASLFFAWFFEANTALILHRMTALLIAAICVFIGLCFAKEYDEVKKSNQPGEN